MKIHNGRFENAFVLEVDVGEAPVWEVDYGEVQIYPDTATGVEAIVLNTEQFRRGGSLEWCYWVHAMDAIRKEQSEGCNVKLTVGGKTYSVGMGMDGLPKCDFDAATGILRFADGEGPELQKVTPGTIVQIVATIPARDATRAYVGTKSYDLPLLQGTRFYCFYNKGGEKEPGGMILVVRGVPSGEQFVYAGGNLAGHWRGVWGVWTPPNGLGNYVGSFCYYNDAWTLGDTGYTVQVQWSFGGAQQATPQYPAFTRTWNVPVRGILFSQAER